MVVGTYGNWQLENESKRGNLGVNNIALGPREYRLPSRGDLTLCESYPLRDRTSSSRPVGSDLLVYRRTDVIVCSVIVRSDCRDESHEITLPSNYVDRCAVRVRRFRYFRYFNTRPIYTLSNVATSRSGVTGGASFDDPPWGHGSPRSRWSEPTGFYVEGRKVIYYGHTYRPVHRKPTGHGPGER